MLGEHMLKEWRAGRVADDGESRGTLVNAGVVEQDPAQPREFRQQAYGRVAEIWSGNLDAGLVTGVEIQHAWPKLPRFSHQRNNRMRGQEFDERSRDRPELGTIRDDVDVLPFAAFDLVSHFHAFGDLGVCGKCQRRILGCGKVRISGGYASERNDTVGVGERRCCRGRRLVSCRSTDHHGEAGEIETEQSYLLADDTKCFRAVELGDMASGRSCGKITGPGLQNGRHVACSPLSGRLVIR
ncbi:MAG: hypothetical protein E5V85_04725 [Mesorhizobium sp.]|nr:MAG: hypothetical protein E5V85_04725 [Mesorhizobium sp.]